MTDAPAWPSPAAALETTFHHIQQHQMHDIPMLNLALQVQALGFRPWNAHWLGILITPWFMNLMLLPRVPAAWQPIGERESRHYVFPAGVFEFIGARDASLGDYQAWSLFSPMFEFATQAGAHDTAVAALEALFDPATREACELERRSAAVPAAPTVPSVAAAPRPAVSKRDFLFGTRANTGDGSGNGSRTGAGDGA